MINDRELLIWIAGFYEGEGTVYCNTITYTTKYTKQKRIAPILRFCITQNYIEPLELCKKYFKSLSINGPYKNKTSKNKHYQCYACNNAAINILNKIKPFLSKRRIEQIDREVNKYFSLLEKRKNLGPVIRGPRGKYKV